MKPVDASSDRDPDKITIRDCTLADSAVIAEIYNHYVKAGGSTMDQREKTAADIAAQIRAFSKRETILVMERGSSVLGWGIIKAYSDRLGYRVACETAVYLRPHLRRQGLGTQLKQAVITRCRHNGYHHLVAKIQADNQASIAYNRKLGYEMVGVQRQIGYVAGRWRDIAIMQLILEDVPPYHPDQASAGEGGEGR